MNEEMINMQIEEMKKILKEDFESRRDFDLKNKDKLKKMSLDQLRSYAGELTDSFYLLKAVCLDLEKENIKLERLLKMRDLYINQDVTSKEDFEKFKKELMSSENNNRGGGRKKKKLDFSFEETRWTTPEELAKRFDVSTSTIYRRINELKKEKQVEAIKKECNTSK